MNGWMDECLPEQCSMFQHHLPAAHDGHVFIKFLQRYKLQNQRKKNMVGPKVFSLDQSYQQSYSVAIHSWTTQSMHFPPCFNITKHERNNLK